MHFPKLFQTGYIGSLQLPNRIVMAPMGSSLASETGAVTDAMIRYYEERAKGGVGLIIIETTTVEYPRGAAGVTQLRITEDRFIPGFNFLVEAIKQHGAKVVLQLNHGGGKTLRSWSEGVDPIAPSRVLYGRANHYPVEMSEKDIAAVRDRFVSAAERAKSAGFDAVELHGANGYLIAQFMSPYTNRRQDAYGLDLEGRMRFPLELVRSVKKATGQDYPLLFRFSADEFMEGGRTLEDSLQIPPLLEDAGVDCLHVSASASGVDPEDRSILSHVEPMSYAQGWRVYLAEAVKKTVRIPVMTVGVIREPEFAEKVISEKRADYVAIGRGLLADPNWPQKAFSGRATEINRCISCNDGCISRRVFRKLSIRCSVNPEAGREGRLTGPSTPQKTKKVAVVGAGPAGMQAAIELQMRGHQVFLFEKEAYLGGQMTLAAIPPYREKIKWFGEYLYERISRSDIQVHLSTEATAASIKDLAPDAVVIATGSKPQVIDLTGADAVKCFTAVDLLKQGLRPEGKSVTVVGGGMVGCETALYLAEGSYRVGLLEMLPLVARDVETTSRKDLLEKLAQAEVGMKTNAKCIGIEGDFLVFQDLQKKKREFLPRPDTIVLAVGTKPEDVLFYELKNIFPEIRIVGDAKKPGKIIDAVYEGFIAGRTI